MGPLSLPVAVLLGLLLLLSFVGPVAWRELRAPSPTKIPDELRKRLGDGLAKWLSKTRRLRAELVVLEERTRIMLTEERRDRTITGKRPMQREIDDANLMQEIRKLQRAGKEWIEQAEALAPADRERYDLGLEDLRGLFDIPWTIELDFDRTQDRCGELSAVLDRIAEIGGVLAMLDGTLSAPAAKPYR